MRRQVVAREHEVEVDEQDQGEHGAYGVEHVADVGFPVPAGPWPAAHEPPGHGHGRRPDRGAGQRAGGGAGEDEPGERPADPAERVGDEEHGQRGEAVLSLEQAVAEAGEGDPGERGRDRDGRRG